MKRDINTPSTNKKPWGTPQLYILDNGTINGGGLLGGHEIHTPAHTAIITKGGNPAHSGTGTWNAYQS